MMKRRKLLGRPVQMTVMAMVNVIMVNVNAMQASVATIVHKEVLLQILIHLDILPYYSNICLHTLWTIELFRILEHTALRFVMSRGRKYACQIQAFCAGDSYDRNNIDNSVVEKETTTESKKNYLSNFFRKMCTIRKQIPSRKWSTWWDYQMYIKWWSSLHDIWWTKIRQLQNRWLGNGQEWSSRFCG